MGRSMDCAIRTDDAMVSRHHARLYWGGQGYVLEDLGSANGVYYQEQRVQSHLLKHGDAVRCGSLWLRFVDQAQLGQQAPSPAPPPGPQPPGAPLMQHPGMGAVSDHGPTGHAMNAVGAQQLASVGAPPAPAGGPPPAAPPPGSGPPAAAGGAQAEEEIRRLRRRIEQLQTELRVFRGGKFGQDKARKMEDLEKEMGAVEEERNQLKSQVGQLEEQIAKEGGSVKVQQAVEIRGKAAEIVTSLNDLLSSLRIEVMAAEGEFDQFSHQLPRASFELIRESLRQSATNVDEARDLLRQLRDVAS